MEHTSRTYLLALYGLNKLLTTSSRNKKFYDPRVWVREGEKSMKARVMQALEDFRAAGSL
jgi:fructose/tagatose bisphosphate aldolase